MINVLITIQYDDLTGKFWWDSSIKNKVVSFDPEKETIHQVIKNLCEDEGMELSYKGKPRGNIYQDNKKTGGSRIVGYIYRGKGEIRDRNMTKPVMVFWNVWVEIQKLDEFVFENIDHI